MIITAHALSIWSRLPDIRTIPRRFDRALERLHAQGHRLEGVHATERRFQRFGGTDGERAADLNRLADPSRQLPDIVLAVRGGYGAARILHGLDYEGLQRRAHGPAGRDRRP